MSGIRGTLGQMSRALGRPVILRGEGTAGGHDWRSAVRGGAPVLECARCPVVWWPDRSEPKRRCAALAGTVPAPTKERHTYSTDPWNGDSCTLCGRLRDDHDEGRYCRPTDGESRGR